MRSVLRAFVAVGFAVYCGLGGAGCLLEQDPQGPDEATSEVADEIGGFSPSLFVFTTVVADDGLGLAGGWQEALTTLNFKDLSYTPNPKSWQCKLKTGMPIRSEDNGTISAEDAGLVTAAKATFASSIVMHSQPTWPIAEMFCTAFRNELARGLALYEKGSRVSKQ
jgi:hypothetical protein